MKELEGQRRWEKYPRKCRKVGFEVVWEYRKSLAICHKLVTSGLNQETIDKYQHVLRREEYVCKSDGGAGEKKERKTKTEVVEQHQERRRRKLAGEKAQDRVLWRRHTETWTPHKWQRMRRMSSSATCYSGSTICGAYPF